VAGSTSEQFSLGLVAEDLWNDDTERDAGTNERKKKKGERKNDKIEIDP
jgi:hypothetical protein